MRTEKKKKRAEQSQIGFSSTIGKYYDIINKHINNPDYLMDIFSFLQEKIYQMVNDNTQRDMEQLSKLEAEIKNQKEHKKQLNESKSSSPSQERASEAAESTYQELVSAFNDLNKSCRVKNLGSEHFLRELGQLFEAFDEIRSINNSTVNRADIALLPSLAASLVAELHSFELMDGDTGNVPLVWITKVLDTLTRDLGDPRILVISVIGVQSSGKSTLLNSMFGLRFPVRAGRCTRGLFFRLLQLDKALAEELGFSYLVVVDTEGIRSIDHDDRRFDNELVTLALSIANITIFNIEGENVSPDMAGILQIAAHALMRMKEVDLECHCRIVQQQVSDPTALERNKANTHKIMETLDEATRVAAEEEGLQGRYQKFSDVVHLQVDESLQYIPCLWTGGMSPPNHLYSDTVTRLKTRLLQDIREEIIVPDLNFSQFTDRVRDVWRAVKAEDFVFNFQDSVRAVAFNQFCLEYNKWIVEMRLKMVSISPFRFNRYRLVFREYPDIFLTGSSSADSSKEQIRSAAESAIERLLKYIDNYVAKHPQKQSIYAYKQGFVDDAKLVVKDVENQLIAYVNDEYELRQVMGGVPEFQMKWRYKLILEAKGKAISLRESGVECITDSMFEKIWTEWMEIISKDMKQTKTRIPVTSLQLLCEKLLLRVTSDFAVGSEIRSLIRDEGGIDKHVELNINNCSKYINEKFVKSWRMQTCNLSKVEPIEQVVNFVSDVVRVNLSMIDQTTAFDKNDYQLMLQKTLSDLTTARQMFKPPNTLVAKGLLHLACQASRRYEKQQNKREHRCEVWLSNEKLMLLEDLRSFCSNENKKSAERCANFLDYFMRPMFNKKIDSLDRRDLLDKFEGLSQQYPHGAPNIWELLRMCAKGNAHLLNSCILSRHTLQMENFKRSKGVWEETVESTQMQKMTVIEDFISKGGGNLQDPVSLQNWLSSFQLGSVHSYLQDVDSIFDSPSYSAVMVHMGNLLITNIERETEMLKDASQMLLASHHCDNSCPMCGVPCDSLVMHHKKHFSFLHRPRAFAGERYKNSNKLVLEDCTASRECTKQFPEWEIPSSVDNPGITFWHWVIARHSETLAERFDCCKADIPSDWYDITEEEALHSLTIDEQTKMNGRFEATYHLDPNTEHGSEDFSSLAGPRTDGDGHLTPAFDMESTS